MEQPSELESISLLLIQLSESWYLLSTESGSSTQQMHESRPTSVSEAQSEEAESGTSQDTVTDSPNAASAGRNEGESEGGLTLVSN